MQDDLKQYGTWKKFKDGKLPWHKEKELEALERELNNKKSEINKLKNDLTQVTKESKKFQSELEQMKQESENKDQKIHNLQEKNDNLTEVLNRLNVQKEEMTSSIKTLVQECEGYHRLLQNERNKTASLAEEIQTKTKALVHWDVDKEALE